MYCGGKNQEPKLHRSRKTRKEKQENCDRVSVQTKRVCKKKDLISSKGCSHPSKHLVFLSPKIPHIKQCRTSLQEFIKFIIFYTHTCNSFVCLLIWYFKRKIRFVSIVNQQTYKEEIIYIYNKFYNIKMFHNY